LIADSATAGGARRPAFGMLPQTERKQTEESMLSAGEIMALSVCGHIIERQLPKIECLTVVVPLFVAMVLTQSPIYRGCRVLRFPVQQRKILEFSCNCLFLPPGIDIHRSSKSFCPPGIYQCFLRGPTTFLLIICAAILPALARTKRSRVENGRKNLRENISDSHDEPSLIS
jgi:hypothetical protein